MESTARVRYARMSPQKARLVVDMVRGKKVNSALDILRFTNKATARIIEKLIKSAKSNAEVKNVAEPEEMKIETIFVDKGPVMKRQMPRARGRADIIHKPFSHVTVVLKEIEDPKKKKPVKIEPKKTAEEKTEKPKARLKAAPKKAAEKKETVDKSAKTAAAKPKTKKAVAKSKEVDEKPAKKTAAKKKPSKGKES